jgi:hypothetical protein
MTSDGISHQDWDRVHELALAIVNASDAASEKKCRRKLFDYLDVLTTKYGELPSLLATRADYVEDRRVSESLLRQAFTNAVNLGDRKNCLYIALDLAEMYLEDFPSRPTASNWLTSAREFLNAGDKSDWERYRQLASAIES